MSIAQILEGNLPETRLSRAVALIFSRSRNVAGSPINPEAEARSETPRV
jgi:hypothetical protein